MLPEKRKNLIIGIVSIIVLVLIIIILYNVSNYIKGTNNTEVKRDNLSYSSIYEYMAVFLDDDGVYELYGINDDGEESINLTTFYEVQDAYVSDGKLIIYSDAVNEIRYDGEEYYFYELDSFYDNNYNVLLTSKYIVIYNDTEISFWEYGDSDKTIITTDTVSQVFKDNNKIYYLTNNSIYEYDLDSKTNTFLVSSNLLYGVFNGLAYYSSNNSLYSLDIDSNDKTNLTDSLSGTIVGFYEYGILYTTYSNNLYLNKYNIESNLLEDTYNLLYDELNTIYYIEENIYYMELKDSDDEKYVISNIEGKKILCTLENSYMFIGVLE